MNGTDLDRLRQRYPDWCFYSMWATAANGPDRRVLVATRGGVVLADWSERALAAKVEAERGT